ncbi:uncharacterized protein LOC133743228 [Rosa rugosa]|uniref:uncharacterized protein LOC133743228 n=1 Tax=Rosa rugosa TaxID=74645 RepID=UPI002B41842D|nr:uncharacterized protein LOC133743228 [Rosa rugosa]
MRLCYDKRLQSSVTCYDKVDMNQLEHQLFDEMTLRVILILCSPYALNSYLSPQLSCLKDVRVNSVNDQSSPPDSAVLLTWFRICHKINFTGKGSALLIFDV